MSAVVYLPPHPRLLLLMPVQVPSPVLTGGSESGYYLDWGAQRRRRHRLFWIHWAGRGLCVALLVPQGYVQPPFGHATAQVEAEIQVHICGYLCAYVVQAGIASQTDESAAHALVGLLVRRIYVAE